MSRRVTLSLSPSGHIRLSRIYVSKVLRTFPDIVSTLVVRFKKEVIKIIEKKKVLAFVGARQLAARVATYCGMLYVDPHNLRRENWSEFSNLRCY